MSFKKFGGLNYSAKSNIISNHYSNSGNLGITDTLGQLNSKIVSQSHIDMSANSIMNIGSLYFMDGTVQTTAFTSTSDYRIKENIQNLDESFNVDKLRPVTYTNKNTKKQDIGFKI